MTILFASGQERCGTQYPEEMETWLKNYKQENPGSLRATNYPQVYIPLKIHIVGTNTGTGYYGTKELYDVICITNEQFALANMHFYIYGEIEYIDNSIYYAHTSPEGRQMMDTYNAIDLVNIYFVSDPNGACGYYSPQGDAIAIKKSCAGQNSTTLTHELGHFFGMPHTFNGWEGGTPPFFPPIEKVDGSNCSWAGDFFCDTPADYLYYRWSCPYTGNDLDPDGTVIEPDEKLFMSYSDDECQEKFSIEQIDAMREYLTDYRSELLNYPVPVTDSIGTPVSVYPPDGTLDLASNYVVLRWNKVPNATKYHLIVREYIVQSIIVITELLDDTTFLADLNPNSNYYWHVKPISLGNTCAPYTDLINFTTADASPINPMHSVTHPVCFGYTDGSILLNPWGGTTPYSYTWSSGPTASLLTSLASGNYQVTISDNGGHSIVLPIALVNPEELTCYVTANASLSFTGHADGGTPPYTYVWSTGLYATQFNPSSPGNYVLTVTDDHGCLTLFPFNTETLSTGRDELHSGPISISVSPNPVNAQFAEIRLNSPTKEKVELYIYSSAGQIVKSLDIGINYEKIAIDTRGLQNGVYLIRLNGERGLYAQMKMLITR